MGMATAKTIIGQEGQLAVAEDKKRQYAEVMQGVLQAFGGDFDLLALLFCIYEEDTALIMLNWAVENFEAYWKDRQFNELFSGVVDFVSAVEAFREGIPSCASIWGHFDVKPMDQCLATTSNLHEMIKVVEEDILLNGVSIAHDLSMATAAFRAG